MSEGISYGTAQVLREAAQHIEMGLRALAGAIVKLAETRPSIEFKDDEKE